MKSTESLKPQIYERIQYENQDKYISHLKEGAANAMKDNDFDKAAKYMEEAQRQAQLIEKQVDIAWDEAAAAHETVYGGKAARSGEQNLSPDELEAQIAEAGKEAQVMNNAMHLMNILAAALKGEKPVNFQKDLDEWVNAEETAQLLEELGHRLGRESQDAAGRTFELEDRREQNQAA